MAQPVSKQPVPKQVTPASATSNAPTPAPASPELKVESGEPREKIPSGAHSSEVKPQTAQASDPQWRTHGNRSEQDKSDMSISEEVDSNWLQDTDIKVDQEGNLVKPSPANYSALIQQKASTQDKFQVIAWHGMEHILVDDLVQCRRWQEVKITVLEEAVLPDLLTALQKALSESGQQKKVYLKLKMDGLSRAFKLPPSPALQLSGLHIDLLMDCPGLAKLLESENASLTGVIWSSADEPDPEVQSLLKGSHQLCTLELSPLPEDVNALPQMLKLKPKLEALHLGKGQWKGKLLSQMLSHAPKLNRLTLEKPKFSDSAFENCSTAFAKSALREFNVNAPQLANGLKNETCGHLLAGVTKAPDLATLGLKNYGESQLDEALLKAFGKNPAARTLNVLGKPYAPSLDKLLIDINRDRASLKWEPITLKCPDGAVARSYAPNTYDSDSDSDSD